MSNNKRAKKLWLSKKGSQKSLILARVLPPVYAGRRVRDALYRESILHCQTPFAKKYTICKLNADVQKADPKTPQIMDFLPPNKSQADSFIHTNHKKIQLKSTHRRKNTATLSNNEVNQCEITTSNRPESPFTLPCLQGAIAYR